MLGWWWGGGGGGGGFTGIRVNHGRSAPGYSTPSLSIPRVGRGGGGGGGGGGGKGAL